MSKDVKEILKSYPNWKLVEPTGKAGYIEKTFAFSSYLKGVEFAQQVALKAEEADHHPEILILWCKVKITLSTHSAGGITDLDFDLAGKIEEISKT